MVQISDDQASMELVENFKKKKCLPSINPAMEKVGLLVVCTVFHEFIKLEHQHLTMCPAEQRSEDRLPDHLPGLQDYGELEMT